MDDDLETLDKKLAEAEKKYAPPEKKPENNGLRVGAELVGPILAGTFIGWFIDDKAGTKPFFLISFFLLGVMTGFFNIWRTMQGLDGNVGYSGLQRTEKKAKTPADEQES
ncbi:MAG: AtpZ/AtpI family protein [Alphaproteobacteria bacterium]